MEIPESITAAPRSLQLFIDSKQQPFQTLELSAYHRSLSKVLRRLFNYKGRGADSVGPYAVDARLRAEEVGASLEQLLQQTQQAEGLKESGPLTPSADVCLDLLSEGCYCPLTGALLGAPKLKQRQLQQLGFLYCSIRRQQWLRAAPAAQQQMLLHALLRVVSNRNV
ncbi:hypothetical protein Efla_002714 [Eimeria flavescens]